MNSVSASPRVQRGQSIIARIVFRFGQIAFFLGAQAAVLLLLSGRPHWSWAWVYLGVSMGIVVINATVMFSTKRQEVAELVAERATGLARAKDWDKVVSSLWALAEYLILPVVASLHLRFGWSQDPGLAWHVAGTVVYTVGLGLFSWAMIVNAYFSTGARIQPGQTVCRLGPYRFVRHPGYVGAILQSVGLPALLGSWWAWVPGLAAIVLMVTRTAFEDSMLLGELQGYTGYAREVRYRLMPGIW